MFDKLIALGGHKGLAIAAGVVLASTAAIGTFASQDAVEVQEEEVTATATATEDAIATSTAESTETAEPSATATGEADSTPTPEASETAEGDGEGEGAEEEDAAGREGPRGIPDHNPNFVDDEDGECEKGEAAIKVTPSGKEVRVPCHAAKNYDDARGKKHGSDDADDDGEEEQAEEGEEE